MKTLFLLMASVTLANAAPVVERDLPYAGKGSHPLQTLDLYLPAEKSAKARPVFILIHGGGWSAGDKSNSRFVDPKTSWLVDGGYVVASINYRLAPAVKHPGQVEDVCKAIAWMQKHAAKHGGDPDRIYLLGHSAGAQLAALAAVDAPRLKAAGVDPKSIRGVVLLDGAGYDIPIQYAAMREGSLMEKMYRHAFTQDPEKQRDASPVHRVSAVPPPFLILFVARRPDSKRQSRLLADALIAKGGRAKVLPVDKTHATINADCGKPEDPVTKAITAFLR
jgi:acetyl esterase/lipase